MAAVSDAAAPSSRLFFALWPDAAGRAALAAWQPALLERCGGRAMRSDTLHATLAFLGDVAPQRMDDLRAAARGVEGASFEVVWDEARLWTHNRIVYAAPRSAPPQLLRLAESLQSQLAAHGFRLERRPYAPHVTLLRDARATDTPLPAFPPALWRCDGFVLAQSARGGAGAGYSTLERFALG